MSYSVLIRVSLIENNKLDPEQSDSATEGSQSDAKSTETGSNDEPVESNSGDQSKSGGTVVSHCINALVFNVLFLIIIMV